MAKANASQRAKAPSSSERQRLGSFGERIAAQHLLAKGYRIVDTNVRGPGGETDIVAVRDNLTAFVEVRTRRGRTHGLPEESITLPKARRMVALAAAYLDSHPELPPAGRIDLIAVELGAGGQVIRVEHIEDVVAG
jgi:putative endonuclease